MTGILHNISGYQERMSDITRNINKLTTSLPTLSRVLAGACFCTLALLVHALFKETDNATKVLIIKSTTSHKSYHPVFLLMKTIVDMSPTLYGNSHVQIIVKFFLFFVLNVRRPEVVASSKLYDPIVT